MKKVIFGVLTGILISSAAFADGGKNVQAKKVRAVAENCAMENCSPACMKTCGTMPCCSKK